MKSKSDSAAKGRFQDRLVTLTVVVVGAAMVAGIWAFNGIWDYWDSFIVGNLVLLFFVPMLSIILVGEEPAEMGFCIGDSRKVRLATLLLFAGVAVLMIFASRRPDYQSYYPIFRHFGHFPMLDRFCHAQFYVPFVESDIKALLYGWITYGMYMFCWEFFFRGYLLFGLFRTIGWPAVIVQAIIFGILHLGKPTSEVALSFGAGIILGVLALRAKSFLPGFLLHWVAFITMDLLVIVQRH